MSRCWVSYARGVWRYVLVWHRNLVCNCSHLPTCRRCGAFVSRDLLTWLASSARGHLLRLCRWFVLRSRGLVCAYMHVYSRSSSQWCAKHCRGCCTTSRSILQASVILYCLCAGVWCVDVGWVSVVLRACCVLDRCFVLGSAIA